MADALRTLGQKMRALCPAAAPDVLPLQDSSAAALSALLGRGPDDAAAIKRLLDEAMAKEGASGLLPRWHIDAEHMCFVLEACRVAPAGLAKLLETRRVLAQLAALDADEASADEVAAQLARANGVEFGTAVERRVWMQECYSVAYAIKVVANNLGEWTYSVGPSKLARGSDAPNAEAVKALLLAAGSTPRKAKAAGAAARSAKKRERAPPLDAQPARARADTAPRRKKAAARAV